MLRCENLDSAFTDAVQAAPSNPRGPAELDPATTVRNESVPSGIGANSRTCGETQSSRSMSAGATSSAQPIRRSGRRHARSAMSRQPRLCPTRIAPGALSTLRRVAPAKASATGLFQSDCVTRLAPG
jgi:hypothetical protein